MTSFGKMQAGGETGPMHLYTEPAQLHPRLPTTMIPATNGNFVL